MLLVQAHIGHHAWGLLVPLAIVVGILLTIVVVSYRQTIHAYPSGGGSYVVSRENLGEVPSLVAGAALLTDYILTVAVSIAGGVLAMQSAFGFDSSWRVPACLVLIAVMTVANLRGLKESGAAFAIPTYIFMASILGMALWGFARYFFGDLPAAASSGLQLRGDVDGGVVAVVVATRTVDLPFSRLLGRAPLEVEAVARARAPLADP